MLRFGQSQLPGNPGVFDRAHWGSARASIMSGNLDHIGVGLGHPRGNGSHTRLSHQFHRYLRAWIGLLQVIDELGEILDAVNIVVRRR